LIMVVSVVYIAFMDSFFPYDAKFSFIRLTFLGFFLLGMETLYRLSERKSFYNFPMIKRKWMFLAVSAAVVSCIIGSVIPKAGPKWPDPVPYLQSLAVHHKNQKEEEDGVRGGRIGYGSDDSRLGGPFIQDETIVFYADSPHEQYWRVETKDYYTGKGWGLSVSSEWIRLSNGDNKFPLSLVEEEMLDEERSEVEIEPVIQTINHMIYPYGTERFSRQGQGITEFSYQLNLANERIYLPQNSMVSTTGLPIRFVAEYRYPSFEIHTLQKVTGPEGLSTDFYQRYTQLPDTIPSRVIRLAERLTSGQENWFAKVRAVEEFLKGEDFVYDTKNVAMPGPEDDYVDQFLFETRRGYCDNFSTAMAVLLRAVAFPPVG
jgi:Transglutaminase-like superfamily.